VAWPYKAGCTPREVSTVDHDLRPDPDAIVSTVPICKHCGSANLRRNGSYLSIRSDERRDAVVCKDCHRSCYLPLGQHLARKLSVATQEEFILADDARPACPFCGGHEVNRRGLIHLSSGGTTQRWRCRSCMKRFVSAAHRVATVDHRKVQHWESISPKDEAIFLFRFACRNGNIADVRQDIGISDQEKNDLEFLVSDGVLPRAEVDDAIWFRAQVLEAFDKLVHARELQFLADSGLLATALAEPMLKFRDRVLEKFTALADAELAVLVARQKDCAVASAQYSGGMVTPPDCKTQEEEGAVRPLPSLVR
jgi:transposase-like protein